jgi:hypothetical protein
LLASSAVSSLQGHVIRLQQNPEELFTKYFSNN